MGQQIFQVDAFTPRPFAGVASVSKVYEMHDLGSWTIYDSRVATGLALLVQSWWDHLGGDELGDLLRFPCPLPRSGREPPAGFPRLRTPPQARLGFIYASWLCKALASRLNESFGPPLPDTRWSPYHVEMVMWMLGKVRGHK